MPADDYRIITILQEHWRQNPRFPRWKQDGMVELGDKIKKKIADNHNELRGIELFFPEECINYDVFISVAFALDALVIPRSNGFVMRDFGECHKYLDEQ